LIWHEPPENSALELKRAAPEAQELPKTLHFGGSARAGKYRQPSAGNRRCQLPTTTDGGIGKEPPGKWSSIESEFFKPAESIQQKITKRRGGPEKAEGAR
jgi:hypothetical protein